MNKKGFTLIEIAVSIGIIVIISIILSLVYTSSSKIVSSYSNLNDSIQQLKAIAENINAYDDNEYKILETDSVSLEFKILNENYEIDGEKKVLSDENENVKFDVYTFE